MAGVVPPPSLDATTGTSIGVWKAGRAHAIAEGDDRISNVRGLGLIMAFDMPDGDQRNALLHKMMDHGLIGLSSGDRTVRFRPHLAVTTADMDQCLELTAAALKDL